LHFFTASRPIRVVPQQFRMLDVFGDAPGLVCRLSTPPPDIPHVHAFEDPGRLVVRRADYAAVHGATADGRPHGSLWTTVAAASHAAHAGIVFRPHAGTSTNDGHAASSRDAQPGCLRAHAPS